MSKQQTERNDDFFSPAVELYSARIFWDDISKNISPTEDKPRWVITKRLVKENKVDMDLVISSGYHPHKLPIQKAWRASKVGTFATLYSTSFVAFDIAVLMQKAFGISFQMTDPVLVQSGLAACAAAATFFYFGTIKEARRKVIKGRAQRMQQIQALL